MPATMGNDNILKKLYDVLGRVKGKPHVSIDVPQDGAVTLTFDDQGSIEELTEHLISKHGARKFAYISGPLDSDVAAGRLKACRNTLERHGLTLDDRLVFDGQWTRAGGQIAVKKLLDMGGDLPDAVMCGNDDMALSVIEYLFGHGVRVPDEIMVTGFDALQEAVMRGLTTVRRPIDQSARKAIEILNAWIDGEELQEKNVVLSTELVFGCSCGCVKDVARINAALYSLVSPKWDNEENLIRINMLSGSMAGISSETEAYEKFRDFITTLDIGEFYVCADPAVCRETAIADSNISFPPEMLLLFGTRNGKTYDSVIVPTYELVPVLQEQDEPVCLVFCPLYYRDRSLGSALRWLTGHGMTPVHISGDEFLAYGIADHADEAAGLVTVVKDELERMNREDPWLCDITASVGVYTAVPREEDNLDIFMTRADEAMYEDKNKRTYGRRKDDNMNNTKIYK